MTEIYAFKMQLNDGMRDEYKRRHDKIWPELSQMLKQAGVIEYSIHLDPETNILFAHMKRRKNHDLDALPQTDLMKKWWAHMADIMHTLPDDEPVSTPLDNLFEMK
uniref:L-rhamnose mutarotase n=1 Tax=OCS116 cluster bacterium TaxID=2030921 RepID=A0A2A4ZAR2_9PROT